MFSLGVTQRTCLIEVNMFFIKMVEDMPPLKYQTVCFPLVNTKQYVSYRITKLCFHLANTKQYVSYGKTKDYAFEWKIKRVCFLSNRKIMFSPEK